MTYIIEIHKYPAEIKHFVLEGKKKDECVYIKLVNKQLKSDP